MIGYKKRIILLLIIVLAVVGTIVWLIVLPTLKDIAEIKASIVQEKLDLEAKYHRGQFLKELLSDFKSIDSEKTKIDEAFITQGEEIAFITELEKIAATFNLDNPRFTKLKFDDKNKQKNVQELPLQVTITGDYLHIMDYVNELEKMKYYFNLDRITIQGTGADDQGKVIATLDGKVFVKKQ